jgi:pyruvate dehydrogenase E1 component alpha subunit
MPIRDAFASERIPYVSVLDENAALDEALDPKVPDHDLRELYRTMLFVRAYDERRLTLQRQGRIGTFAPVKGQEAAQLGGAYALRETDWMVPAFRETAAAIWRGMRIEDDLTYCAGLEEGIRIAPGARDLPIAIPVASQLPHAVGIAWARKLQKTDDVVLAYFGDGATSEGDFHEAMNFASVFQVPLVFLCQNNQWAISVPRSKQTRSPTLAQKALAYGMPGVAVDGNDLLGVYRVTRDAVDRARNGEGPTLIEAVTYRLSVHTTADDPSRYRSDEEVQAWEARDPILRLRRHLLTRGLLSTHEEARWKEEHERRIRRAIEALDALGEPDPAVMFDHVYHELPRALAQQRETLHDREVQEGPKETEGAPRGRGPPRPRGKA